MTRSDDAPHEREPDWTRRRIERLRHGDRQAAEELFRVHHEFLVRVARDLLSSSPMRRFTTPEDLAQATILRALSGDMLGDFEAARPNALRAALKQAMKWELADQKRNAETQRRGGLPASVENVEARSDATPIASASPAPSPTSVGRAREVLRFCQAHFSQRDQALWRMRIEDGLTFGEIAALLDESPGTVQRSFDRLRARLVHLIARTLSYERRIGRGGAAPGLES